MPDTPVTSDTLPDPDSPGDDLLFSPTPDFLGDLNPLDLLGIAASAAPREWQPPPPAELNTVLPGYVVTRLIGQGGMGAVYEARHNMTGRTVALKFLPADRCASDPVFAERSRREVQVLSLMDHPNIVRVFDSSTTSAGDLYFTMELVNGETLAQRLRRSRPGTAESMAILRQVCDAVAYAHSRMLIHRDLKPANILIGTDGVVKVVDFGLAVPQSRTAGERLTRTGIAVGTYEYCSPEQLAGGQVDPRADVYSLGVITYQLLTGELPVGAFDPPSLRRSAVAQGFDAVVMRALLTDPEGRYPSAEAYRDALVSAHETALLMGDLELIGQDQALVLQDFYEKIVGDVPSTVRWFIEDKLLTPSGYRDSRPLDDALVNHGIPRPELERLVDRHLLRIEERAGVPRVEISHDRLTGVIQASRDLRRAAEAAEESRERERQLRHKMRIRVAIAVLGALAATGGGWGWLQYREAQQIANDEREARRLLMVMTDMTGGELAERLEPIGRLNVLDPVIEAMDHLFSRYRPAREDSGWNNLHARYLKQKAGVFAARGRYTAACEILTTALSLPRGLGTAEAVAARTSLMRHLAARGLGHEAMANWPALDAALGTLPDTPETGRAKALALEARSMAQAILRNLDECLQNQRSALLQMGNAISAADPNRPDLGKWEHDLALMHLRQSDLLKDSEANGETTALAAARQGNTIAARLAASPKADPRWSATYARSWRTIAELLTDKAEREKAWADNFSVSRSLTARDPENILWLLEYASASQGTGLELLEKKQWGEAIRNLDTSVEAGRRVVSQDSSVSQWQWDFASYLITRGTADKKAEYPGRGAEWFKQAIEVMERFVNSSDSPVSGRVIGLGVASVYLGEALRAEKRYAEAIDFYTAWIERGRKNAESSPVWHFLTANSGWEKTSVLTEAGNTPAAKQSLQEAIADLELAYQKIPKRDWPAASWGWRGRPARVTRALIESAPATDQPALKKQGTYLLELLRRFTDGPLPKRDLGDFAPLENLLRE